MATHYEIADQGTINKMDKNAMFLGLAFRRFLNRSSETIHRKFRTAIAKINIEAMDENVVGYTDSKEYFINLNGPFAHYDGGSNWGTLLRLLGVTLHEICHRLFTSFTARKLAALAITTNATFYPRVPEVEKELEKNKERVLYAMRKHTAIAHLLGRFYLEMDNAMEDGRIERLGLTLKKIAPLFVKGLEYVRSHFQKEATSFAQNREMWDAGHAMPAIINFLIHYSRFQTLAKMEPGEEKTDCYRRMEKVFPFLDQMIYATDRATYYENLTLTLLSLWDILEPEFIREVKASRAMKQVLEKALGEEEEGAQEDSKEKEGVSKDPLDELEDENPLTEQEATALASALKKELEKAADKAMQSEAIAESASENADRDDREGKNAHSQISNAETEVPKKDLSPEEIAASAKDMAKVLEKDLREEAKGAQSFAKSKEGIVSAIKDAKMPKLHHDVRPIIYRKQEVSPEEAEAYEAISAKTAAIAKKTWNKIKRFVTVEDEAPMTLHGRYCGTSFDAWSVAREDFKNFSMEVSGQEAPSLSCGIRVDLSGSMGGERIDTAKVAASVFYALCQIGHIPCTILGDCCCGEDDELYWFSDWENRDNLDARRIMGMRAFGGNKDGYAIRVLAERMAACPTKRKLMIILSDGAPSAYHGGGAEGAEDIRTCIKEFERKGFSFIAAGIGTDNACLQEIYGANRFLNISNLNELPQRLADVWRREMAK